MDQTVGGTRTGESEPTFVLVPQPRRVGPGRIERGYQRRIEELERDGARDREHLRESQHSLERSHHELETAARVERGLQRLADRLEERLETAAQREKRLILALGALQKENELLRGQLALGGARQPEALPPAGSARPTASSGPGVRPRSARTPRRGLLSRLFGR